MLLANDANMAAALWKSISSHRGFPVEPAAIAQTVPASRAKYVLVVPAVDMRQQPYNVIVQSSERANQGFVAKPVDPVQIKLSMKAAEGAEAPAAV